MKCENCGHPLPENHLGSHLTINGEISLSRLMDVFYSETGVTRRELRKKSRARSFIQARTVFVKLARDHTNKSYTTLARYLDQDHTTVVHTHTNRKLDEDYFEVYLRIKKKLEETTSSSWVSSQLFS
jgi:chromosomal replication initiation ATPase DnaA